MRAAGKTQATGSVLGEPSLKLVNELFAFCFGGEKTALQSPFHIPPSFILFNLLRPVVSFDFHLILNLPERADNHRVIIIQLRQLD